MWQTAHPNAGPSIVASLRAADVTCLVQAGPTLGDPANWDAVKDLTNAIRPIFTAKKADAASARGLDEPDGMADNAAMEKAFKKIRDDKGKDYLEAGQATIAEWLQVAKPCMKKAGAEASARLKHQAEQALMQ